MRLIQLFGLKGEFRTSTSNSGAHYFVDVGSIAMALVPKHGVYHAAFKYLSKVFIRTMLDHFCFHLYGLALLVQHCV